MSVRLPDAVTSPRWNARFEGCSASLPPARSSDAPGSRLAEVGRGRSSRRREGQRAGEGVDAPGRVDAAVSLRCGEWQVKGERAPLANLALDPDLAAVSLHDLAADVKAKT